MPKVLRTPLCYKRSGLDRAEHKLGGPENVGFWGLVCQVFGSKKGVSFVSCWLISSEIESKDF